MILTNPECKEGKHPNCDGSGWDDAADEHGSCPCACHAKPTLYIAGPMTGLPDLNYPAFHQAEGTLRAAGYRTLNPASNTKPNPETWEGYMRVAITQLVQAGGVAVLPGWNDSRGARLEVAIADALSIPVREASAWAESPWKGDA